MESNFTLNYERSEFVEDSGVIYYPKKWLGLQATMGALGRLSIDYIDIASFLEAQDCPVYLADMDGTPYDAKPLPPGLIVFGNEGNGIRASIREQFNNVISIQKSGGGESLNISIASAIIMAHFSRS